MADRPSNQETSPVSSALYRDIVEGCADAVVVIDRAQTIQFMNKAAEAMFGRYRADALGKPLETLIPKRFRQKHHRKVNEFGSSANRARFMGERSATLHGVRASGEEFPVDVSILKSEDDGELNFVAIIRDITEREKLDEDLKTLASTDPLTGALNRRAFMSRLEEEYERSVRYGQPMSFAMIDVDHFKKVNDAFGHQIGDLVLSHLVHLMSTQMRKPDILGRWGGEEFALLLPAIAKEAAVIPAERLRRKIQQSTLSAGSTKEPVKITVSIGVAGLDPGHDTIDTLIQRADRALYTAKSEGRNRVSIADLDPIYRSREPAA